MLGNRWEFAVAVEKLQVMGSAKDTGDVEDKRESLMLLLMVEFLNLDGAELRHSKCS